MFSYSQIFKTSSDNTKSDQLCLYAEEQNYLGMETMLRDGACVNKYYQYKFGEHKETLLHHAVKFRDKKMILLLLTNGGDLAALNSDGQTPIQCAMPEIIQYITGIKDTNARDTFKYGKTIEGLIRSNDYFTLKSILGAKANPNGYLWFRLENHRHHETFLHLAMRYDRKSIVSLLLRSGADLSLPDSDQIKPINACSSEMVRFVANQKKTDEKDSFGYGITLHKNIKDAPTMYALLSAGAPVDSVVQMSSSPHFHCTANTPLHLAVYKKQSKTIFLLRSFGANENAINLANMTPRKLGPEYFETGWLGEQLHLYLASVCVVISQGIRQNHKINLLNTPISDGSNITFLLLILSKLAREYNHTKFDFDILAKTENQLKSISKNCFVTEHKNLGFFKSHQSEKLIETLDECNDAMNSEKHIQNYIDDQTPKAETTVTLLTKYRFINKNKADQLVTPEARFKILIKIATDEIANDKNNPEKYLRRAHLFQHQKKTKDAYTDYIDAIKLNSNYQAACDGFVKFMLQAAEDGEIQNEVISRNGFVKDIQLFPVSTQIHLYEECLEENSPLNLFILSHTSKIDNFFSLFGATTETLIQKVAANLAAIQKNEDFDFIQEDVTYNL